MNGLKDFLRKHILAILFALLSALIIASPQAYFRIDKSGSDPEQSIYQGIELLPDSPWSPRVREIQDGHMLGSIYYKEGKEDPYLFQPLGSSVVAYLGKIFSLEMNNTLLFSRLLLTVISFLVLYTFVYLLSERRSVALCATSIILLANSLLSYSSIKQTFKGISPEDFLEIARPVNPAMIYILFFGFLALFWLFYRKKHWGYGVGSALLLGLNFYNYFYSWTYLFAFGGLLTLIFFFQRKWKEALRIMAVFAGALIVVIPYGINLYQTTLHPAYEEASIRFGVVETHTPLFVGFVVIAALAVFFIGFPREDREKYFFGLALLLTPFVTLNQQLITGKVLQPAHYHWYFHKPMAVIFGLIVLFYLLHRFQLLSYKKIIASLILVSSVGYGVFVQAASYHRGTKDGGMIAIERQKYGAVVEWLNEHGAKEEVVMANSDMSHMTVIYTPLNVFYHRAGMYTLLATKERLLEIIFAFYRLRGIDAHEAEKIFFEERGFLSWNIYGMHYREVSGAYEAIPDEKVSEISTAYKNTLIIPTSKWLKDTWNKHDVSYVIWDKEKDPIWNLDGYSFLEKKATFGNLIIYQLKQ